MRYEWLHIHSAFNAMHGQKHARSSGSGKFFHDGEFGDFPPSFKVIVKPRAVDKNNALAIRQGVPVLLEPIRTGITPSWGFGLGRGLAENTIDQL